MEISGRQFASRRSNELMMDGPFGMVRRTSGQSVDSILAGSLTSENKISQLPKMAGICGVEEWEL
jgi:hypothetical protein